MVLAARPFRPADGLAARPHRWPWALPPTAARWHNCPRLTWPGRGGRGWT